MFFWRDFVFLFICFCTDVIVFRDYISEQKYDSRDIKEDDSYYLVVGILSARGNFNQRKSLRKTWVGNAKREGIIKKRTLVKFIISDQACMIPPEYRADPYKCQENVLKELVLDRELNAYKLPFYIPTSYFTSPVGRDFAVLYPIVITSLGISESGLHKIKSNATVRLYDKITKKEIVSATFTEDSPGTLMNGSWFKAVPSYVLPKGFQGSVVCENFNGADSACKKPGEFVEIQEGGGLIVSHKVKRFDKNPGIFPEKEETIHDHRCPYTPATFIYHAHVSDDHFPSLPSDHDKETRFKEWKNLKDVEIARLFKESQQFSDILLVRNVDVYRNLPSQLLEFYRWVSKNVSFSLTLKTDDDCFLDLEGILKAIDDHKLGTRSKIWWSRFRTDWLIDRHGKWAEPDYPGVVYPTFACGAGNVLSADLVHWLARNADSLKRYQGEDVSMGIWLSAVAPTILKDERWSCFQECFQGMFTSPEQDTESLHELWENFQYSGNPCTS